MVITNHANSKPVPNSPSANETVVTTVPNRITVAITITLNTSYLLLMSAPLLHQDNHTVEVMLCSTQQQQLHIEKSRTLPL